MEPPGTGPHSGQGSTCLVVQPGLAYRCAGWSHLARTRRCGQAKLWTVTNIDLSHPRLSIIPALAATLQIGQLAVRNHGKPLHTISSSAVSGVAHVPKGAWNAEQRAFIFIAGYQLATYSRLTRRLHAGRSSAFSLRAVTGHRSRSEVSRCNSKNSPLLY